MFTRKTFLTGLQFTVLGAIFAQGVLAIFFTFITPNLYRAVVTHEFMKNCAWVALMYPGYLEHCRVYSFLTLLLGIVIIMLVAHRLRLLPFVRALSKEYMPVKDLAMFLGGLTILMLLLPFFPISLSMLNEIDSISPDLFVSHSQLYPCITITFIILLILSITQWKHRSRVSPGGNLSTILYSLLFSGLPACVLYLGYGRILSEDFYANLLKFAEYVIFYSNYREIATITTILFSLGGFLIGLFISIFSYKGLEGKEYPLLKEGLSLGAIILICALFGSAFTQHTLIGRLHLFVEGEKDLGITEGAPFGRKVIIFGQEHTFRKIAAPQSSTYFTTENIEHMKQYLMKNRYPTVYSGTASARIIDWHILNWDLPGAMNYMTHRIQTRYDDIIETMISIVILARSNPSPQMEKFVSFLGDHKFYAYPGARSCLHLVKVMENYGRHDTAEEFLREAGRKVDGDKELALYYRDKKPSPDRTGELDGSICHNGSPLPDVKVRLFPFSVYDIDDCRALSEVEGMLLAESDFYRYDTNNFINRTSPKFFMMNIYAVSETDPEGRFHFEHLPPDSYVIAIKLEGGDAAYEPLGSPGFAEITRAGERVTLPTIELR